jgi:SAM-dependent methyltransferase
VTVKDHVKRHTPERARSSVAGVYHAARANSLYTGASKRWLMRAVPLEQRRLLESAQHAASPNDSVSAGGWPHYLRVGLDAIRCIDTALARTSTPRPSAVLDMPCGWGRVMRFLAARLPEATLTACDIVDDAVGFCARRFGARPVRSSPAFSDIDLGERFGLIWCGSLVTHIDATGIEALLQLFARSLEPEGLAVVTAHGEEAALRARLGDALYELGSGSAEDLLASYEREGFGFAELPESLRDADVAGRSPAPYGISLTSRAWMRVAAERAGLRLAHFAQHDWDGHQDVYGFVLDR